VLVRSIRLGEFREWPLPGRSCSERSPARVVPVSPSRRPPLPAAPTSPNLSCSYTLICSELASQGYVVLALDHADGSASAAQLPRGAWKLYGGLGDEAAQVRRRGGGGLVLAGRAAVQGSVQDTAPGT
jgi:hypothetical protein